jgi:hypothetical protein
LNLHDVDVGGKRPEQSHHDQSYIARRSVFRAAAGPKSRPGNPSGYEISLPRGVAAVHLVSSEKQLGRHW